MSIARWTEQELADHLRQKSLQPVSASVIAAEARADPQPIARGRRMNKLETAYDAHLRASGLSPRYEAITLKIGFDCRLTPDFFVNGKRPMFHECKGPHAWEDSLVKLKAAATLFPMFDFYLVKRIKGEWVTTYVQPA